MGLFYLAEDSVKQEERELKEYAKNVQEVLRDLGAAQSGLSSEEAEKRIEKYGKNASFIKVRSG